MSDKQTTSFYLPQDVREYLKDHPSASEEVTRLVRRQIISEREAEAFERLNGVPLTGERRQRAKQWSRASRAAAAQHAAQHSAERDDLMRRMGWAG
jgi:hypothetical protein